MDLLIVALFERLGILLVAAFIFTRLPSFKFLLEREMNWKTAIYYSLIFGFFSIAGTLSGVQISGSEMIRSIWFPILDDIDGLAHSGIVGIVMAGLLGGPIVGLGAGLISGLHLLYMNGMTSLAFAYGAPFIGILTGLSARFFSKERVISPIKSLFIGMFATIISMCMILIFTSPSAAAILFVNFAGIPMVITNSVAIAIFTTMIRVVLHEKEQAQAIETKRALNIAERVLPFLKNGLTFDTAHSTAKLLMEELRPAAVAVTDTTQILAHLGSGAEHHLVSTPLQTESSRKALSSGHIEIVTEREQIQCKEKKCPLGAAILVPFIQSGKVAGLIKLYFKRAQQIRAVDIALAQGLGKLISNQLSLADAERITVLMREAELRTLQAQINPHFLFNTLNSIVSLIRINPTKARHITVQLAQFMRTNLKILSTPMITLEQELTHLKAYLEIVDTRFSEQLQILLDVDENLRPALIPPSTLQPLVENCIEHGLQQKSKNGHIEITISQIHDAVNISVMDNGIGIAPEVIDQLGNVRIKQGNGNGVGVYNVNQRLISLLGASSSLQICNQPEGGSVITFKIPNV
jgi:two-component system sensor histidine kinase LytS